MRKGWATVTVFVWALGCVGCGAPVPPKAPPRVAEVTVAAPSPDAPPPRGVLRLIYVVEGGAQPALSAIEERIARLGMRGVDVAVRGDRLVVDIAEATPAEVEQVRAALAQRGELVIQSVDDEHPVFSDDTELAQRILVELESTTIGSSTNEIVRFARIVPKPGESQEAALASFERWAASVPVPPGSKLAFGEWLEPASDPSSLVPYGWRTYLLYDRIELGRDAIADAAAAESPYGGWQVTLTFTPDGTEAFARLTERHRKRRIAIVLDDIVMSAPVVQERIAGGSAVITIGGGPADEQRLKATTLATALSSSVIPALTLEIEEIAER